jgi:hypothetical protein
MEPTNTGTKGTTQSVTGQQMKTGKGTTQGDQQDIDQNAASFNGVASPQTGKQTGQKTTRNG